MTFLLSLMLVGGVVLADFFLPVVPSSAVVTTVVGFSRDEPALIAAVLIAAAGSSWLGEVLGHRIFRAVRSGRRTDAPRAVTGLVTRTVLDVERALRHAVDAHPYRAAVAARFLPAGRTALAWVAAGSERVPYARMAALGASLWAVYAVGLGLLAATIAGPDVESLVGWIAALLGAGGVLTWVIRRRKSLRPAAPEEPEPVRDTANVLLRLPFCAVG
ncbi:hypothetical protein [Glycomyces sp. NPDC047010]|uniref:DedA family protein n=1 Tax=Glycomyces sp. NPDC047010 TaxID=3155023 RepID=UPI0033C07B86